MPQLATSKNFSSSDGEWPPAAPAEVSPISPTADGSGGASPRHPAKLRRKVQTSTSHYLLYSSLTKVTPRSSSNADSYRARRRLFTNSPLEREVRVDHHGRQVSEIDALTLKFEPEFKQIVPIIADVLQLATRMGQLPPGAPVDTQLAAFNTPAVPNIPLDAYVTRIGQNAFLSPASLVVALIFLDRLLIQHPRVVLTPMNVYKLYFVACRVASKVVEIRTLNNKNFAPIGGVDMAQLNTLEAMFLTEIKFELFVDLKELAMYGNEVLRVSALSSNTYVDRLWLTLSHRRLMSVPASASGGETVPDGVL